MVQVCQLLKRVIVYARRLPVLFAFLHVDIRALGTQCHDLGHDSRMTSCLKQSAHNCTVNFSDLGTCSTRQSHGLFALAEHLFQLATGLQSRCADFDAQYAEGRVFAQWCAFWVSRKQNWPHFLRKTQIYGRFLMSLKSMAQNGL